MSQAKIDQYKKEKANRKNTVKKKKTKKKVTTISLICVGVLLLVFLVWGIIATVKDGGLNAVKQQQEKDAVTQELIEYLNSNSDSSLFSDENSQAE